MEKGLQGLASFFSTVSALDWSGVIVFTAMIAVCLAMLVLLRKKS